MGTPRLIRLWYTKSMVDTFQLKNPVNQLPPRIGPKHDTLHMADGLQFCWCNCQKCFAKTADGSKGVCICRECPCQGHYMSRSPMYVPRNNTGGRQ